MTTTAGNVVYSCEIMNLSSVTGDTYWRSALYHPISALVKAWSHFTDKEFPKVLLLLYWAIGDLVFYSIITDNISEWRCKVSCVREIYIYLIAFFVSLSASGFHLGLFTLLFWRHIRWPCSRVWWYKFCLVSLSTKSILLYLNEVFHGSPGCIFSGTQVLNEFLTHRVLNATLNWAGLLSLKLGLLVIQNLENISGK